MRLWYQSPAEDWNSALPLGNGKLGAMVFGGPVAERIQLNEDSLWSSGPMERNNRASLGMLPTIQKKVLEGKMQEAEDLISQYMFAAPYSMPRYECLGELDLALNQHTPFTSSWTPHSLDIDSY